MLQVPSQNSHPVVEALYMMELWDRILLSMMMLIEHGHFRTLFRRASLSPPSHAAQDGISSKSTSPGHTRLSIRGIRGLYLVERLDSSEREKVVEEEGVLLRSLSRKLVSQRSFLLPRGVEASPSTALGKMVRSLAGMIIKGELGSAHENILGTSRVA